jgi:hypothetical protein
VSGATATGGVSGATASTGTGAVLAATGFPILGGLLGIALALLGAVGLRIGRNK